MVRFTVKQRVRALEVAWNNRKDWPAAAAELRATWPKDWGRPPPRPQELMERVVDNVEKYGTVFDAPRPGPRLQLDAETCEVAAELFMQGHYQTIPGTEIKEWHGYSCINDALKRSPALARLWEKSGVRPRTLFDRILRAHPEIHKYTRDYKSAKTPQQRRERRAACKLWLQRCRTNRRKWLEQLVWFDEGTIELEDAKNYTMREYADADDERRRTVLTMPLPAGSKKIKLCFYLVVDVKHGLVCIYLTTGTTDLQRLYVNIPGETKHNFKVRGLQGGARLDPNLLAGITVHRKRDALCPQRLDERVQQAELPRNCIAVGGV